MALHSFEIKEIEKAYKWLREYWDKPIHPEFYNTNTIDEALSLLEKYGNEARLFAGGTDVMGLMKNKVLSPGVLVNIKPIKKLKHISLHSEGAAIGALTRISELEKSSLIRRQYPILFEAAHAIGSPHIRNMATIAGNLCQDTRCWYFRRPPDTGITFNCRRKNEKGICYALSGENQYHAITGHQKCVSVCPSDMATVLLAVNARIKITDQQGGRVIPVDELYGPLGHTLNGGEIISTIQIPKIDKNARQQFIKFRTRKTIDFAIASVATVINQDKDRVVTEARIVIGGVSWKPYRALKAEKNLIGERLTGTLAEKTAKTAVLNFEPLSKNAYKVPIVKALVKRALLDA